MSDNATPVPDLALSIPDVALSRQPALYPLWFLLKRQGLIPVALRTRDVVNEAFDSMLHYGMLRVVPSWAERLMETIDRLIVLD
jgi:hypothetical protein